MGSAEEKPLPEDETQQSPAEEEARKPDEGKKEEEKRTRGTTMKTTMKRVKSEEQGPEEPFDSPSTSLGAGAQGRRGESEESQEKVEVVEEKEGKKGDSGRQYLAKRALDEGHPGIQYLNNVLPGRLKVLSIDPQWRTIAEMLKDQRQILVKFPFCEETVAVKINTYLQSLYEVLVKKGRVPEEEKFFMLALQAAVHALLWDEKGKKVHMVTAEGAQVNKELVQDNVNSGEDPSIIRTNNHFAASQLKEEVWTPYLRIKIKPQVDRDEVIPKVSEKDALLYLYQQVDQLYQQEDQNDQDDQDEKMTDIERVHLYILLLDESCHEMNMTVKFQGTSIEERFRHFMKEAIRYPIGITGYSAGTDEKLRKKLTQAFAKRIFNTLIGRAFKQRGERHVKGERRVKKEILKQIDKNVERLIDGNALEPIDPPREGAAGWKLPNGSLKDIQRKFQAIENGNDFVLMGLLGYLKSQRDGQAA